MKLKVYYNNWLPKFLNVYGITLYPFVCFAEDLETVKSSYLIEHETIHVRQIRKIGFFKFYFFYYWEYLKNYLSEMNNDKAYYNISYEKEAYENESKIILTEEEKKEFKI